MNAGLVIYGSLEHVSGGYLYDRKLVEYLEGQGVAVEVLGLPYRSYARHLTDNFSYLLAEWLRAVDFDVLLQDELNHPSLWRLNERVCRSVDYPIVSIVHHLRSSEAHPGWLLGLYRRVERRYLRSVDAFIFNSETTRRTVEALAGEEKPHVVAYPAGDRLGEGLSPEAIAARADSGGPLEVVFVGNVIERKGLHTLLDALAQLADVSWRLTVAGSLDAEPGYTGRIKRQVERLGLGDRVTLAGPLPDDALAARLAGSDVLAVPSFYEGFGIAYLEGMAFGLPAIAGTGGGAAEIVTHGGDGFLIPPGDAGALARCLRELAADRERLREMSLAARRRYEAHPGWADTGARIHDFLTNLVGRSLRKA